MVAVAAAVTTDVMDQEPRWVVYTLTKVVIKPMVEFIRLGLLLSTIGPLCRDMRRDLQENAIS